MESQIWHLPARSVGLWGKGSEKGQWPLPTFLSGRKLSSSSCLDADTSVFSHMPLLPVMLLPRCWRSEGVSLSKSVCGFFQKNCLRLQKSLPLTQSPLFFAARSFGDLSSWHWNPGLGAWCEDGTPHSQDIPLNPLSTTCGCGTSLFHLSTLPASLDGCGFFNSLVVRIPFNTFSDGSKWWLFYILVVIFVWCARRWAVYLCHHLDQQSWTWLCMVFRRNKPIFP